MLRGWIDSIRRNHGLEHATVTILLARHGPRRMAGRAASNGFYIIGDVDEAELNACAREALDRMQRGEEALAVSPLCGTNIAVTGLMTAAATAAVLRGGKVRQRFGDAFTAAMVGVVLAQPVGRLVQERLTTRGDLQDIELVGTRTILPWLKKVYTAPRQTPA